MEAEVIAQALSPVGVVVCSRSESSEHLQQVRANYGWQEGRNCLVLGARLVYSTTQRKGHLCDIVFLSKSGGNVRGNEVDS
jgi:hypothetical protein